MDIWSSAQGVYIFVGTNDISVVRCDAHTELPKWEFLSLVGPGMKKSWAEVISISNIACFIMFLCFLVWLQDPSIDMNLVGFEKKSQT